MFWRPESIKIFSGFHYIHKKLCWFWFWYSFLWFIAYLTLFFLYFSYFSYFSLFGVSCWGHILLKKTTDRALSDAPSPVAVGLIFWCFFRKFACGLGFAGWRRRRTGRTDGRTDRGRRRRTDGTDGRTEDDDDGRTQYKVSNTTLGPKF